MKTLVTGGGGFLGSHLVARLEADGHDVVVPRRAEVDLTHWDEAERLFRDTQPERVFHLAGEVGGIGANRLNPGRFWYANLMMGAHVLELSREHGVGKLVIAGTVCAYPKFAPVPFREADLWDGYPEETNAPYGVAKKSILVGAQAYREQYGLDSIFLLPANLYGPRDNFDLETSHVIPGLIRKMLDNSERVTLWGDGSPTREFLYVDDCVEGLVLAAERYDGADAGQPGHGRRDLDSGAGGADRGAHGLRRRDRVGHLDAERPAASQPRREPRPGALRLRGAHAAARRARADDRVVPRARGGRRRRPFVSADAAALPSSLDAAGRRLRRAHELVASISPAQGARSADRRAVARRGSRSR